MQGTAGRLYPATRLPVRASDDGIGRLVIITQGEVKGLAEDLMTCGETFNMRTNINRQTKN